MADTLQEQKEKKRFEKRQAAASPSERKATRDVQIKRRLKTAIEAAKKTGLTTAEASAEVKKRLRAKGVKI